MFRRTLTGRLVARMDDVERSVVAALVTQVLDLIEPEADIDPLAELVGIDPGAVRPDDPALLRLFPDAYAGDDEAAGQFRRFTERSLRTIKAANAHTVLDTLARSGDKVTLTQPEAQAWLLSLTDVRLALAVRLGIEDDDWDHPDDDDPSAAQFHVYDWLTHLQESLVLAMTGESPPASP